MWARALPETSFVCNSGDHNITPVLLCQACLLWNIVSGLGLGLTFLISAHGLYEGPGLKKRLSPKEDSSPHRSFS